MIEITTSGIILSLSWSGVAMTLFGLLMGTVLAEYVSRWLGIRPQRSVT